MAEPAGVIPAIEGGEHGRLLTLVLESLARI